VRTLAVTGHRPEKLYGYDFTDPRYEALSRKIGELVANAYAHSYRQFISGCALGADMLFAEAVIELRQKVSAADPAYLTSAVPYITQAEHWPAEARQRWLDILKRSDLTYLTNAKREIRYLEVVKHLDSLRHGKSTHPPTEDYERRFLLDRNQWIVDRANSVLVIWDGKPSGTADCVRRAQERGIKVVRLDPVTLKTIVL
jgi:uncharacterized phage-like protein YoqJ